jgi:hypothetical protein
VALGSTQPLTEISTRDKGGRYVGLKTLPASCWSINILELLRPVTAYVEFALHLSFLLRVLIQGFVCFWRASPQWARASSFIMYLDHTQRRTTVGRTSLDEWSARSRDLFSDNTQHSKQTDNHARGWIRTHNLSRRAAADLCLRPRSHWDRSVNSRSCLKSKLIVTKCSLMKKRYSNLHVTCKAGIPQCILVQMGRPRNRVSVPGSGRVCSPKRPDRLLGPLRLLINGHSRLPNWGIEWPET